jgi:hypothetical protein
MAIVDQPQNTYENTLALVRIVDDVIRMIDPIDTPLLSHLGGLAGANSKFDVRGNGKYIELFEDTYAAQSDALPQDINQTIVTITVTDGSKFQPGFVIRMESELMVVTAVSGQDVTVEARGYGGSAATHTSTAGTIYIEGMARLEGDDADYVGLNEVSLVTNYTSILHKALKITGSDEAVDYYGMGSPFAYQAKKAIPELLRLVEKNIFRGVRAAGTKTTTRSAGGLGTFITSNTSNTTALDKVYIDNVMQYCFEDGGDPDLFVCNPEIAKDLKALIDSSNFVRVDQSGGQFGMRAITYIETQFGTARVLVDRWCPLATAWFLKSSDIGVYTLRPFGWSPLAKTGDSHKAEVVGEFSLLVANGAGMGSINTLT